MVRVNGPLNSGKSTFLCSLIGEYFFPISWAPETHVITMIMHDSNLAHPELYECELDNAIMIFETFNETIDEWEE